MQKLRKKIAIVWANPYNQNLGVSALAYSSLAFLYDIFEEIQVECDIFFIGSSKFSKDQLVVGNKSISFFNLLGTDYLNVKSILRIILRPKCYQIFKLKEFDFIFDIAEGDSFTDIYGEKRFKKILNSKKVFHFLGKKQILLPQTIGPFNSPHNEKAAVKMMKKLLFVMSRDNRSYNYTKKFLSQDKIIEVIDLAFYLPYERKKFSSSKINVGLNISALLWNGGYTEKNQFNLKSDYQKIINTTLEFFSTEKNVQVHIISHVLSDDIPVEDDSSVAKIAAKKYPDAILSPKFNNPIEAKNYISGLDFFIGARMHACIASFSSGVPVFPLAYSRKFNGLFIDTLRYNYIGDCVAETEEVIITKLKQAFLDRRELKKLIRNSNEQIVKPRLNLLKNLLTELFYQ